MELGLERERLLALLQEAGERHGRAMTCREWDEEGLRPSSTAIRRRLGGWKRAWREAGWSAPGRRWQDEEILARLREAGEAAGGAIGRAAWSRERRRPSVSTVVARFGSWRRAWQLAGFPEAGRWKQPPLDAIRRRLEEGGLTGRQEQVLRLVLALGSESAAARALGVTSQAVAQVVQRALRKMVASQGAKPRGR